MRILSCLTTALLIFMFNTAHAQMPDIDSSKWAANPEDYGMTALEFIHAESQSFFDEFIDRAGINKFHHFTTLATADDTWVVSPNVDTVYSVAIVNVSEGFTLKLPDVGDRFLSIQIIDYNHLTPFHLYGGGTREFTADQFITTFVVVGLRIGTDATDADIAEIVKTIHPEISIEGAKDEDTMPRPDRELMLKVREPMNVQFAKLENTFGVMQARPEDVTDWEVFTYVTAGAWGLSMEEHAMYIPYTPEGAVGGECWIGTFPPVPAKEFFSITLYGPDRFLMTNTDNVVSSNRGVVKDSDGSFTVVFGGEQCRDKAPNFAHAPEDGWSLMLRAYRPYVDKFRAYEMPVLTRIK